MRLFGIFLLLMVPCAVATAASAVLVRDGQPQYAIVLPEQPDEFETQAALELRQYLGKICGVPELPDAPEPSVRVEIGGAAQNEALRQRASADECGFFIEAKYDTVRLAGTTPVATLFAVYELLERLGCRWFMPGEIGEVVPHMETIRVEPMSIAELPDFKGRKLQSLPPGELSDQWAPRAKLGGPYYPGSHSFNRLVPPKQYFETHPEYYSLVAGERQPTQLCTSNPAVIEIAVQSIIAEHEADPSKTWFGIGPNDGGGFCECDNCRALDAGDWDPFSNDISITDRFLTFANAVAEQVNAQYPELRFAFYVYHNYMRPPKRVTPHPSIIPALAPIHLCRLHGLNNPVCPERNYCAYLIAQWGQICDEVYHRGYSYNLAGPSLPLNYTSRWAYEIPFCKRAGITGFRVETATSWANHGPLQYLMVKLMWDADQDVEALLDDYFDKYYGPAAVPMKRYWQLMDEARSTAPYHTGNAVNIPDIYPNPLVKRLGELVGTARRMAQTEPYKERVHITSQSLAYLRAFLQMQEASGQQGWPKAKVALDNMRAIAQWMEDYSPQLVHPGVGVKRIDRFWAQAVEQATERVTGDNRMVFVCPDEWATFLDPDDLGEDLLYYSPQVDDGAWQRLKTHSASWSDQGLRYYKGVMWYRCTAPISAAWQGRRLMLWFGAVDEAARAWVNGELVGEAETNGWDPFEMEITNAVRLGQPNLICVKATNARVNELGTGGIQKPVMVWSPGPERQPPAEEQ